MIIIYYVLCWFGLGVGVGVGVWVKYTTRHNVFRSLPPALPQHRQHRATCTRHLRLIHV